MTGKVVQLKEAFKGLITNSFNTDFAKNMVGGLTTLVNGFNTTLSSLDKINLALPMMLGAFGGLFGLMKRMSDENYKPIMNLDELLGKNGADSKNNVVSTFKSISTSMKEVGKEANAMTKVQAGFKGLNASLGGIKSIGLEMLSSAITGVGIALASWAIAEGIKVIYNEVHKLDIEIEELTKAVDEHKTAVKHLEANKKTLKGYADTYYELSKKQKLTDDESARLKESLEGIAEIMPQLVLGYDEDGSPILAMSDDVEGLIKQYEKLIEKEKEALMRDENKLGKSSLEKLNNEKEVGKSNLNRDGQYGINNFNKTTLDKMNSANQKISKINTSTVASFEETSKKVNKAMGSYESAIEDNFDTIAEKAEEKAEDIGNVMKLVSNSFSEELKTTKLSEDAKKIGAEVNNAFDFIGEDLNFDKIDIDKIQKKLVDALAKGKGEAYNAVKAFADLREEYAKTSDIATYEKSVANLVPQLAKALGLTEEQVKQMVALSEVEKTATDAQDAFLRSFGYNNDMVATNEEAEKLALTYNQLKDAREQLLDMGDELLVDGKVKVKPILEVINETQLPDEFKNIIKGLIGENSELTEEQYESVIQLMFAIETGDSSSIEEAEKQIQEQFGDEDFEVDLGTLIASFNVQVSNDTMGAIAEALKKSGINEDIQRKIKLAVSKGDLEEVKKLIDGLPKDKQIEVEALVQQALNNLNTVDGLQLSDKWMQLFGDNTDALNKYREVEQMTPIEKTVNFVGRLIGDAWNFITGTKSTPKVKSPGGGQNIGFPRLIDPNQVSAMSYEYPSSVNDDIRPLTTASAINTSPVSIKAKIGDALSKIGSTGKPNYKINITLNAVSTSLKNGVSLLIDLENALEGINSKLSLTEKAMDNVYGKNKIKYLQTAISLLKTQSSIYEDQYEALSKEESILQKNLKSKGIKFDGDGNISNYSEKINSLDNQIEKLGDKKGASKQKESLENLKKAMEEYTDVHSKNIYKIQEDWLDAKESIRKYEEEIKKLQILDKTYKYSNNIKQIEVYLDNCSSKINIIESQLSRASGSKAINLIKEEIIETNKQLDYHSEKLKDALKIRGEYGKSLSEYGFKIDDEGNISNLDTILNKYQDSEELDYIKDLVDSYNDYNNEVRDSNEELANLTSNVADLKDELDRMQDANNLYKYNSALTEQEKILDKIGNSLDLLSAKSEYAYGSDKIEYMKEEIALYEQGIKSQKETIANLQTIDEYYKNKLSNFGFTFDSNGDITNLSEMLDKYKDSDSLGNINELLETFYDIHNDKLPEALQKLLEYENNTKKVYEQELNVIKDVEDKITDMIKDNIEKRKDALKDSADKQIELINKVKQAYDEQKSEDDYNKKLTEQQEKIAKINKEIALARKDNSLAGKAKLEGLLGDLEEANKDLNDIIKNRQDELIGDMFDKETDRIQQECDDATKKLEETWTDSKIAEAVKEALGTGVFTDLDGNIISLEEAMLNFAESSGEAVGILADKVKYELTASLQEAMEYLQNYPEIMKNLGIEIGTNTQLNAPNGANTNTISVAGITININGGNNDPTEIANEVKRQIEVYLKEITGRV